MTGGGVAAAQHRQAADPGHRRALPRRRERAQLRRARHGPGAGALRVLQEVARAAHLGHDRLDGRRRSRPGRAFVDLHAHSAASFDSLARPAPMVERAAAARGLTHLAITDHERIDGALRARGLAPARRCRSSSARRSGRRDGDLLGLFLERAVPPGLSPPRRRRRSASRAASSGCRIPFDRFRGSASPADGGARRARRRWSTWSRPTTRAARRQRQPAGGGVRARHGAARRGLVGRPLAHGGGRRYDRPRRRPVHPAGLLARCRVATLVTGRALVLRARVDAGRQARPAAARQRPRPAAKPPTAGPQ